MKKEELIRELQGFVDEYYSVKHELYSASNKTKKESCKMRIDGIESRVRNYYMKFDKDFLVPDIDANFLSPLYFISDLEHWIDILKQNNK